MDPVSDAKLTEGCYETAASSNVSVTRAMQGANQRGAERRQAVAKRL